MHTLAPANHPAYASVACLLPGISGSTCPFIVHQGDKERARIAEHPVVPAGLVLGGACIGIVIGYRVIADPVAAILGGFAGATTGGFLHQVLRAIELCARPERDELDDALDRAEAAIANRAAIGNE